jgi:hypothetical protein
MRCESACRSAGGGCYTGGLSSVETRNVRLVELDLERLVMGDCEQWSERLGRQAVGGGERAVVAAQGPSKGHGKRSKQPTWARYRR